MAEYVDLVVVKGEKPSLYRAPAWSDIKQGDKVIVETDAGESLVTVERTFSARTDDEYHELDFILVASGADLPLKKVLAKANYLKYEEEQI
jgi:hypothetical protein